MKKYVLLLVAMALLFVSCSAPKNVHNDKSQNTVTSEIKTGLDAGNKAPDFSLKALDGSEVKLSDYENKIVVLNFFGVWCPWCKKEMPGFVKVYNDYKDKGVELLVVDSGDTEEELKDYLKEQGFGINPVLDVKGSISALYEVRGFPTTYIIDKGGIIQKVHAGFMDQKSLSNELSDIIEK